MVREYPEPEEAADSIAPHSISFTMNDGRVNAPYYLKDVVDEIDFEKRILEILGYNLEGTDGRIHRVLPRSYGLCPFLLASSINLVGYGVPEELRVVTDDGDDPGEIELNLLADPTLANFRPRPIRPRTIAEAYALYSRGYTAVVEFLQRSYHPLPDDDVGTRVATWFDEHGDPQNYYYAEEWKRFTEVDQKFSPKIITATQGQLTFRTGDGSAPHRQCFAGSPRLPYPEKTLTVLWRQVPYRYLSSPKSFLERFANKVNQHPFTIQGYSFEPGELLFMDFDYSRYTPPFPFFEDDEETRYALEKWVDLKLIFGVARRHAVSPPTLPNRNWIPAGWNVLPWFGPNFSRRRGFHYAGSFDPIDPDDKKSWMPLFESFPMELLFTDPDVPQPVGFFLRPGGFF